MSETIEAYRNITASPEFKERERMRIKADHDHAQMMSDAKQRGMMEERALWQGVVAKKDATQAAALANQAAALMEKVTLLMSKASAVADEAIALANEAVTIADQIDQIPKTHPHPPQGGQKMTIPNISNPTAQMLALANAQHSTPTTDFGEILARAQETARSANDTSQVRLAAQMFEAYFIQMMFREMRRTNFNENGLIPRSNAEVIFTEMLDQEMADQAAAMGGVGLADMLYAQLTRRR